MNKFKNYLMEGAKLTEFLKNVKRECQPFLKRLFKEGKYPLYRGVEYDDSNYLHLEVRKDRRPTDTKLALHHLLDQWFFETFKIKARSECLFVSLEIDQARDFPQNADARMVLCIFPVGNINWIHSNNVRDLYEKLDYSNRLHEFVKEDPEYFTHIVGDEIVDRYLNMHPGNGKSFLLSFDEPKFSELVYTSLMETFEYEKNVLPENSVEMMIDCDEYYAIKNDTFEKHYDEILSFLYDKEIKTTKYKDEYDEL